MKNRVNAIKLDDREENQLKSIERHRFTTNIYSSSNMSKHQRRSIDSAHGKNTPRRRSSSSALKIQRSIPAKSVEGVMKVMGLWSDTNSVTSSLSNLSGIQIVSPPQNVINKSLSESKCSNSKKEKVFNHQDSWKSKVFHKSRSDKVPLVKSKTRNRILSGKAVFNNILALQKCVGGHNSSNASLKIPKTISNKKKSLRLSARFTKRQKAAKRLISPIKLSDDVNTSNPSNCSGYNATHYMSADLSITYDSQMQVDVDPLSRSITGFADSGIKNIKLFTSKTIQKEDNLHSSIYDTPKIISTCKPRRSPRFNLSMLNLVDLSLNSPLQSKSLQKNLKKSSKKDNSKLCRSMLQANTIDMRKNIVDLYESVASSFDLSEYNNCDFADISSVSENLDDKENTPMISKRKIRRSLSHTVLGSNKLTKSCEIKRNSSLRKCMRKKESLASDRPAGSHEGDSTMITDEAGHTPQSRLGRRQKNSSIDERLI